MRPNARFALPAALAVLALSLQACDRQASTEAGRKIEAAAERTKAELAEAGKKTQEAIAEAGDKLHPRLEAAGEKIERAGDRIANAADKVTTTVTTGERTSVQASGAKKGD